MLIVRPRARKYVCWLVVAVVIDSVDLAVTILKISLSRVGVVKVEIIAI